MLPYLGMPSLCLRTRLRKSIISNISFCKIKIIFKSSKRLANFFRFKNETPLCLRLTLFISLHVVDAMLPITVKRAVIFKVRVGDHSGTLPLMNKRSKSKKSTAVEDHMLICDQPVSFDDFKVLASSNSKFHLKIKESLLILCDQPILNKNEASLPLHLFD